jgi:hypothetical protein
MAEIESIEEYRRKREQPKHQKKPLVSRETPRARSAGEPIFDVQEVLRHLESMHNEMSYRLLDSLEEAILERLDQIRRYGLGLSRRISVALARKVQHEWLRDYVREQAESPRLELRRGLHVRMLQVPLTPAENRNPAASAYVILVRGEGMLTLVMAAVRGNGTPADHRFTLRRPCGIGYWSRDVVDQLLRRYLRELFEELESGGEEATGA